LALDITLWMATTPKLCCSSPTRPVKRRNLNHEFSLIYTKCVNRQIFSIQVLTYYQNLSIVPPFYQKPSDN
jgi:hypothetical protein